MADDKDEPIFMAYQIELSIPVLPKLQPEGIHHMKVAKYRKDWHDLVFWHLKTVKRPPTPLSRVAITFTRYSEQRPDYGNLVNSFKAVLDGLIVHGIITDDNPDVVEDQYLWSKTRRADQNKITIALMSIPPPEDEVPPIVENDKCPSCGVSLPDSWVIVHR